MEQIPGSLKRPYSVDEASEKSGLEKKTIRRGITNGQIVAIRIGRRVLIPAGPFDRLIGEGQ